ncbi:MAG TPA: hypothetical protein VM492_13645 [Sumerlaeia bacterium]|nr:hypothetical protein [Sumerlaeia bacterium]
MATVEVTVKSAQVEAMLAAAAKDLAGGPEMRDCLEAMGEVGLAFEQRQFIEHSAAADPFWAPLSDPTVILRRGAPRIFTQADIEAKRSRQKKQRDTGVLFASLGRNAAGNVFEIGQMQIAVGTRDSRAATLHSGGVTGPFEFDEEKKALLKKNVPPTRVNAGTGKRFSTPRKLKSGKRHEWKAKGKESPWNPLYFFWRAVMRKWEREGRRGRVPARPIIVPLDSATMEKLKRIATRYLARITKRTGG